jgi:hypothetical protein
MNDKTVVVISRRNRKRSVLCGMAGARTQDLLADFPVDDLSAKRAVQLLNRQADTAHVPPLLQEGLDVRRSRVYCVMVVVEAWPVAGPGLKLR